jgi:hypothetical protein
MNSCPKCNISWIGEPIPKDPHDLRTGGHYGREISIDGGYMGIYDGIVALRCPDCGHECPRNSSPWALELFEKYQKVLNGAGF